MIKKVSLLIVALLLVGAALVQATPSDWEEIFTMWDPQGDSFGPGDYTYPTHESFPPELPQMLDLTGFRVFNTPSATRFEFHFAQPPNLHQPWGGAGFNFHRVDLYIATGEPGSTQTFRDGARVEFRQPWQINLRLRDWMGAYLIHWEEHNPDDPRAGLWQEQVDGFDVFVEENMLVAEISHDILGPAAPNWKYYVLVGLQDAYGPDQYRDITQEAGPWTGGGGCESEFNPNVYDILAETVDSQQDQLSWDVGQLAQLRPVGPETGRDQVFKIIAVVGLILLAAGLAVFIWIYAKR